MTDPDPWAQASDPTIYRVPPPPTPALPPPGVYEARRRPRWPLALAVVGGGTGMALLLVIGLSVAIPVFLNQREKGLDHQDAAERSESQVVDGVVDGYGYRYDIAPGWVDADGKLPDLPSANVVDTATMLEATDGYAESLLIVEVERTRGASMTELESVWRQNATESMPAGVRFVDGPGTSIAGSDATVLVADGVVNELGAAVDFRALLAIRDDHVYALTFVFQSGETAEHQEQIDQTLATWEWE